ncbi:MAG: hypothetical protein M1826_002540 [Phylliscum demangeonii]|nr:MAG: hypothetical protein M1826_002540 [Phylliscum demangeonii]
MQRLRCAWLITLFWMTAFPHVLAMLLSRSAPDSGGEGGGRGPELGRQPRLVRRVNDFMDIGPLDKRLRCNQEYFDQLARWFDEEWMGGYDGAADEPFPWEDFEEICRFVASIPYMQMEWPIAPDGPDVPKPASLRELLRIRAERGIPTTPPKLRRKPPPPAPRPGAGGDGKGDGGGHGGAGGGGSNAGGRAPATADGHIPSRGIGNGNGNGHGRLGRGLNAWLRLERQLAPRLAHLFSHPRSRTRTRRKTAAWGATLSGVVQGHPARMVPSIERLGAL